MNKTIFNVDKKCNYITDNNENNKVDLNNYVNTTTS